MHATRTSAVFVVAAAMALLAPLAPQTSAQTARKLQVSFSTGNVTLVAQGVTLREILAEWSRQGGCRFEGADRLAGGTMPPVQFDNQPEAVVMDSLLRAVAGYMLAPRAAGTTGASQFEAVYILATSHPTTPASFGSPVTTPIVAPIQASPDDEIPPVAVPAPGTGAAAPARQPQTGPTMPGAAVPMPSIPGAPGRVGGGGGGTPTTIGRGGGPGGGDAPLR